MFVCRDRVVKRGTTTGDDDAYPHLITQRRYTPQPPHYPTQLSTHTIQLAWSPAEELHGQFGVFNRSASNKQVAIKIKTTHPNIYRVRPATAIIEPGSSVFVKVVRTATKTIKEADPEGHRFVIVCVPVKFGNEGGSDEPDAPFTAKLKVKVV